MNHGRPFLKISGLTRSCAAVLVVLMIFPHNARTQTTVTLDALKDNTLYESATGALSNGAGEHFFVGQTGQTSPSSALRRGLIAFDIASNVPAGAKITSVTLTLNMSKTSSGAQNIDLRRVLKNWGEGTSNAAANEGSGANAATGDATWIHAFFNTSSWASAGGDFSATASASRSVADVGSYAWGSTAQMVSDVQGWLDSPSTDFGWALVGNESLARSSKRFDTKENAVAGVQPKLTVTYTLTMDVHSAGEIPRGFVLKQNFPNPFNPTTQFSFSIAEPGFVVLKVYDVLGKEVAALVNKRLEPGAHTVRWDAASFPSGVYFYRLETSGDGGSAATISPLRKMVLLK